MASPRRSDDGTSTAAAAVCCMCGDRGLPRELFRCSHCRLRLQHRYCSDLYPRVPGPYRSCNWCLVREDGDGGGGSPVKAAAEGARGRMHDSRDDDDDHDQEESPGGVGCSRSAFSPDPEKPVKKPKSKKGSKRGVQRPPVKTTAAKERREVQAGAGGGKARPFRVKVPRYKLLAEVIC